MFKKTASIALLLATCVAGEQQLFLSDYLAEAEKYVEDKIEEVADNFGLRDRSRKVGESKTNRFGNVETVLHHDTVNGMVHKSVDVQENGHYYFDYKQQAKHLEEMTTYLKGHKDFVHPDTEEADRKYGASAKKCHQRREGPKPDSAFNFLPI